MLAIVAASRPIVAHAQHAETAKALGLTVLRDDRIVTFFSQRGMSAFGGKADIGWTSRKVSL
jgi:hypothetical protein